MAIRLTRPFVSPTRALNHRVSALSPCQRTHRQANSTAVVRARRSPALARPLVALVRPARIGRSRQPDAGADLPAIGEAAVEQLVDQRLRVVDAEAFELCELHDLRLARPLAPLARPLGRRRFAAFGFPCGFDRRDLPIKQNQPLVLARDLRMKPRREPPSVAGAGVLEHRQKNSRKRPGVADPLRVQERPDPVGVGGALLDEPLAFAVGALLVLLLGARRAHDRAGLRLAAEMGEEGAHGPPEVDPIGLGPARPPVDLDARGIDLMADHALALKPAVQLVSVEPRFGAGQNPRRQPAPGRLGARRRPPRPDRSQVAALDREAAHGFGAGKKNADLPVRNPVRLASFPGDAHGGVRVRGGRVRAENTSSWPPRSVVFTNQS